VSNPSSPATAQPKTPVKVTLERGQRKVFCGLAGIVWLHRKIQDAFFLVVGSRTCAHLLQSAAGVMIFAEPRFATAILQDRDLAGMADCNEELDRVVAELLARRPDIGTLFLVGSCPSEVIKLDLQNAADACSSATTGPGAHGRLQRQRHRNHLHPGRRHLPGGTGAPCRGQRTRASAALLVAGTLSDIVEDQFRRLFDELGIGPVPFCRRARGRCDAPGRPGTRLLLAQPYLTETVAALTNRGAEPAREPVTLSGAEGTAAWLRAAAEAWEVSPRRTSTRSWPLPVASRPARRRPPARKAGRSSASCVPPGLAAGAAAGALPAARVRYAGDKRGDAIPRPAADGRRAESLLTVRPRSSRAATSRSAARCLVRDSARTSRSAALASPTRWKPRDCARKWSIELIFSPIQGFDQAGDLAALFSRPLLRQAQLAV
jgi:light-independent protochlorophyllide reductase subunit N